MLWSVRCLMLAGLLTCTGCLFDRGEKLPPEPGKKTASARVNDEDNVPAAVSKLLPPSQVDEKNAHAQAQRLYETLQREKGQIDRTESARVD